MRQLFTVLFSFLLIYAKAQQIELSGNLPDLANKKIAIQQYDHPKGNIPVNSAGKFSSTISLPQGYYQLKEADILVYLEPGMAISISKVNGKLTFTGKGRLENNTAAKVADMAVNYLPLKYNMLSDEVNMVTPDAFLAKLNQYRAAAKALVNETATSAFFKSTQYINIDAICNRFKNEYLGRYGVDAAIKQEINRIEFEYVKSYRLGKEDTVLGKRIKLLKKTVQVKTLSPADSARIDIYRDFDMSNEVAYRNSTEYRALFMQQYYNLNNKVFALDGNVRGKILSDKVINTYITNPFLKEELSYQYMMDRFRLKRDVEQAYQEYITSSANKAYINDVKTIYMGSRTKEGALSPDFVFPDANGAKVSLSSMRGSYVYIDLWATYCIPCIGQIPALKALDKKYEGRNIRFVSISVDATKDKQKWKNFVAANKLTGIQLFANGTESEFHKYFNVFGIPRFILIGPDGKVLAEDALQATDPELQKQLDGYLGKS